MPNDDVDVLQILERIPQLGDAQIWEIARRCRIYRSRPDGADQVVDIEMSVDTAGRWMAVAHDAGRNLTAQGVPMPGLNGAIHMVPWYVLDDPASPPAGPGSS
jgi:hypothetical protein